MRQLLRSLICAACLFAALGSLPDAAAQKQEGVSASGPAHVCTLPPAAFQGALYIPPPGGRKTSFSATFDIDFVGPWPAAAQTAFQYAADIWGGLLNSPLPIGVTANWSSLGAGILGSAGSNGIIRDFPAAPQSGTWYARALANALQDFDFNGTASEINATFNSDFGNWYFGTDGNTPAGQYDFVTVVLHELGHGLGFFGSMTVSGSTGNWGYGTGFPAIYDRFANADDGTSLLNNPPFANPSANLRTVLTGGSVSSGGGGVFFDGAGGNRALYTPGTFNPGSSYSHFDTGSFPNELMKHALPPQQAIHDPGLSFLLLNDIGWLQALPVELVAFNAQADRNDVVLHWETASETNNAGFHVEHRYAGDTFEAVAFVEGFGTTLEARSYRHRLAGLAPGRHVFRLKQVDYDGTFEYSPEVEVTVALPDAAALSPAYPNPFNPETRFTLVVATKQEATVAVYDMTGRRVATLHDGPLAADVPYGFTFDARDLPSGLYVVRATGQTFMTTTSALLVR